MGISENLEGVLTRISNERSEERRQKGPLSFPPENFDQAVEADFHAWRITLPNFHLGGHWFSKTRFGLCWVNGKKHAFEIEHKRVVTEPKSEPASTADPVDWDVLQPKYDFLKRQLMKRGYDCFRLAEEIGATRGTLKAHRN